MIMFLSRINMALWGQGHIIKREECVNVQAMVELPDLLYISAKS